MPNRLIKVSLSASGKSTVGELTLAEWSKSERRIRAIKILFIFWTLALVTLFIPLLHFVLVPLFLLAGPIVSSIVHAQKGQITGGTSNCPLCGAHFKIAAARDRFPLQDICESCHRHVQISKVE